MDVNNISVYNTSGVPASAAVSQPAPVQSSAPVTEPAKDISNEGISNEEVSKQTDSVKEDTAKKNADNKDNSQNSEKDPELDATLKQINQLMASFHRRMEISVHSKLNRIMVKVVDTEQNKVIKEIPPEKVLDAFAKALELAGVLIDVKQ